MRTNRLYPVQIFTIITSAMLGVRILNVQHDMVLAAGRDGWISVLMGGMLAGVVALLVSYPLSSLYPESDLPKIILLIFGKIMGRILIIPLALFVIFNTGFTIRLFVQAVRIFLLEKTPNYALVILMVAGVMSVAKRGINAIGASVDFMFPVYVIPLFLLFFLAVPDVDMNNLQPVLHKNFLNVFRGVIPAYASMVGYGGINYFLPYALGPKNAKKWLVAAIILTTFLYTGLTAAAIGMFGKDETQGMLYPTFVMSKSIEPPITILERLEALMITVWIPGVFAWLVLFTFASMRNFMVLFNLKEKHKGYLTYAHGLVLAIIALFPRTELRAIEYSGITQDLGAAIALGFVPLMLIIGLIKRRRKKTG